MLSGVYILPLQDSFWRRVSTLASGLPYNIATGVNNSGDTGATTHRPGIDGVVIARNAGRGKSIYDIAPFPRNAPSRWARSGCTWWVRAEAFNVVNHPELRRLQRHLRQRGGGGRGFGSPGTGITNQLPARSLQFSAKVSF